MRNSIMVTHEVNWKEKKKKRKNSWEEVDWIDNLEEKRIWNREKEYEVIQRKTELIYIYIYILHAHKKKRISADPYVNNPSI